MDPNVRKVLERQHYHVVGEHSGVKLCHWARQKLLHGRVCYKEAFYGIESHRCLQMTPALDFCNHACLFCWRFHGFDAKGMGGNDEPEDILEGCIRGQGLLVSGFKGDPRCDVKLWEEAHEPNQVAISLSGEPTFYPRLGEFIGLCKDRGMTTFLVTNGTTPRVLEALDPLPTQLYVTVPAPDEESYKRLCAPYTSTGWARLNQTLEVLPSLDTRTVIRHTLVEGWNCGYEDQYAKLDEKAEPDFIEPKGYVFVGYSRTRMTIQNMPSHARVRAFGERLANLMGMEVLMEMEDSRVVLVGPSESRVRLADADVRYSSTSA